MDSATRSKQLELARRSWLARAIAPLCDGGEGTRASFVATNFWVDEASASRGILHISAMGLYRAFLNGKRVGHDVLTPGWTCYDNRIDYQSYDVGSLLVAGENRFEIWLGDGWFRSPLMWRRQLVPNCWGSRIAALAEIVAADMVIVRTGADWRSGLLPVTRSGIYYGEDFDARLERLDETHGVETLPFDPTLFVASEATPVREMEPLAPIDSWADAERGTVYDFGQNVAGYVRLTVRGETGASVRIEHSEVLGPKKEFDNRNYRSARSETSYVLKGEGEETWQPHFTFMGYRFARISVTGNAEVIGPVSIPISSVPVATGCIATGVPAVDKLVQNTIWSQRANFIEIPTDCPQRDERMGWTGDAQVFAGTACWLADSNRFLRKYLRDVMHDQRPNGAVPHVAPDPTRRFPEKTEGDWSGSTGWGDVIVQLPWQLYLHYGDVGVLRECFPAMLRWLEFLWNISGGPIIRPSPVLGENGFTFGDWLQPVGDNRNPRPTIGASCAATLCHFISTDLAADIAGILGDNAEQARLTTRAGEIRAAFLDAYVSTSGQMTHDDQTSYALALLHGIVPDGRIEGAKDCFRRVVEQANYLIGTGFIGTPALLPALTRSGMRDVAEKVFLNRNVPGWLYQVDRGATTIWERWDAIAPDGTIYDPTMNSYNHYAYGSVCQWLFEDVAGVCPVPEAPGFDRVRIAPTVLPGLGHVSMWHNCRHGRIEAGWKINNRRVVYVLLLPVGCVGVIDTTCYRGLLVNGTSVGGADTPLPSGRSYLEFDLE